MIDKTVRISNASIPTTATPVPVEDPSIIQRIRLILLLLIGILLILCSVYLIFILHSSITTIPHVEHSPNSSAQLVSVLMSIIYFLFGLIATYRRSYTGLFVFAWLGFASLLLMLAVIIVILIGFLVAMSHFGIANGLLLAIVGILICLTAALLQVLTVRYAFVLSNLLKRVKHSSTTPV